MKWAAIIPAAGFGERFGAGDLPKQYSEANGRPLIYYALRRFETSGHFSQIVVAVADGQATRLRAEVLDRYGLGKQCDYRIVVGGADRGASVFAALQAASGNDFVAIHDAARPCLSGRLLMTLMQEAERYGAVVPGYPLPDTIKEFDVDSGEIRRTVDRRTLWAVQTPQCFRYELIVEAYKAAMTNSYCGTDDAELVERLGRKVRIVRGDTHNLKLTYPEDLRLVRAVLENSVVEHNDA